MRILLAAAVISMAFGIPTVSGEAPPQTAVYMVYPIASELQRIRLARSNDEARRLRTYVAISGNELIGGDGAIIGGAIPTDDITKALAPYADRDNGIVVLNMQFGNESDGKLRTPSKAADELLRSALEKTGRAAGFKAAMVSSSHGGPILQKKLDTVTDKIKGQADEEETPSGDELVTVYPVRTILSLLLTENADCVVAIRTPLENDGEKLLSAEVREAIVKHVAAVKLRDKSKLQISVKLRGNRISNDRLDAFIRAEVADIAQSLGFASYSLQSYRVN